MESANNWAEILVNYVLPLAIALVTLSLRKYLPQAADIAAEKRTVEAIQRVSGGGNGNGNGHLSHFNDIRLLYGSLENRVNDAVRRQDAQSKDVDNLEQRFEAHNLQSQQALEGVETRVKEHTSHEIHDLRDEIRKRLDSNAMMWQENYKFQTATREHFQRLEDGMVDLQTRVLKLEGAGSGE